jgi:ribosomal protein S18 acetylase RimI-like enzyme
MPHSFELKKTATFAIPLGAEARPESLVVEPLTDEHEREALAFLSTADSVQAIFMTSMVRDNGLESPFNRGIFYGARRTFNRELSGVALIGHATLVEASDTNVLKAFAHVARACPRTHVHLGEEENIKQFWRHYARGGQRPRLVCRELLFELRDEFVLMAEKVEGLRLATLDDLSFVMPVQACMAFEESGVNPMERDAVGFRLRCARRIEQGRVFVWVEDGRLIFKADIVADTPDGIYLEGIYVSDEERGKGYGLRCLSQLSRNLLARTKSICLLVNERNWKAQAFYLSAGYKLRATYETIFLGQQNQ